MSMHGTGRTRRVGQTATAAGLATMSLLLAAGPSAAAGTIDQQQTDRGTCHGASEMVAQTFTAGLTGQLDQVDVLVVNLGDTSPITVEIRPASGDVPTDTVLATATIPSSQVPPTTIDDWTGDPQPGFAEVSVPIGPVPVIASTQYAYVLHRTPLDLFVCGGTTNPYAGGRAFTHGNGQWNADPTLDTWFRTYVSPPPPPAPAPDGALSGVLTAITKLVPALAPVIQPVRNLLRGLGL
jgi:hypothetical protein